jgi:hypothetical protein
MNNLAISLAVGATALFVTAGASAAPLSADVSVVPQSNIQHVRMVCNENGRCWRERVNPAIHTDTRLVSVISSAGVTTKSEAEVLVSEPRV